jgi:hypothetical protein
MRYFLTDRTHVNNYHIVEICALYLALQDLKRPMNFIELLKLYQTLFHTRLNATTAIHKFFYAYAPKARQTMVRDPFNEAIDLFMKHPYTIKHAFMLTQNLLKFRMMLTQNVRILLKKTNISTLTIEKISAAIYGACQILCMRQPRTDRFLQFKVAEIFGLSAVGMRNHYNEYFRNPVFLYIDKAMHGGSIE